MTGAFLCPLPPGTAQLRGVASAIMDIILHIGAHRTGTTTFQHYVRDNLPELQREGIGFWGPHRTRKGLFSGLYPAPGPANGRDLQKRAAGRIRIQAQRVRNKGIQQLIVSDENMIGAPRDCMRRRVLYPAIGERMARLSQAFEDNVRRVVMSVRSQDLWWASLAAYTVGRGYPVPGMATFDHIAFSNRTWRDVITDLACAVPGADIVVVPFENAAGRPQDLLAHMTNSRLPTPPNSRWMNRSLDLAALRAELSDRGEAADLVPEGQGRWNPFSDNQSAALREAYTDDIMWLAAGANGMAQLAEDTNRKRAGSSLPSGDMTRGIQDDQGQLARSG